LYSFKTFLFRGWERVLSRNFVEHRDLKKFSEPSWKEQN
jgi:hypothetical protein